MCSVIASYRAIALIFSNITMLLESVFRQKRVFDAPVEKHLAGTLALKTIHVAQLNQSEISKQFII